MPTPFQLERLRVHQSVVSRVSNAVSSLLAFLLIFSTLLTVSNWPAYSLILQDMIDPSAMAQVLQVDTEQDHLEELKKEMLQQFPEVEMEIKNEQSGEFNLSEMGELYPNEMRLEIPKLFSQSIPVQMVDTADFSFKDLYASENKIQEALREGVVHYPYTANPDQPGNVFITGHSSYYPWDKGRYKDVFALLHKLEVGDEYSLYYKGKKYNYRVSDKFEVQPDDVSVLAQPLDSYESTLMTCTPVGTTLRRLIVKAELVKE